jgi:hypothetical protein
VVAVTGGASASAGGTRNVAGEVPLRVPPALALAPPVTATTIVSLALFAGSAV